jgi:ferric-dicitrate binding protein FerR (iron transport regulator)
VLGTSFNIRALPTENIVTVTVTAGKVSICHKRSKKEKVFLTAGEKGEVDLKSKKLLKKENSETNYKSWKTGKLQFKNSTLIEVCEALNKYYKVTIEADTMVSNEYSFTGMFEDETLEDVLEILELTLDIEFQQSNNKYLVVY